jgi:hypothetical protein
MRVFLGHPNYDFVYRCETRGADFGNYVGMRKGEDFVEPLPLTTETLEWTKTATSTKITGDGIDGDGVFHGTPKGRVFVEATKGCEDVFGKYPENLKKYELFVLLEKDSPRLRQQFVKSLVDIVSRYSDPALRMQYRDRFRLAEEFKKEIDYLLDRYFK